MRDEQEVLLQAASTCILVKEMFWNFPLGIGVPVWAFWFRQRDAIVPRRLPCDGDAFSFSISRCRHFGDEMARWQLIRNGKFELEQACRDLDAEIRRKDELMVQVCNALLPSPNPSI